MTAVSRSSKALRSLAGHALRGRSARRQHQMPDVAQVVGNALGVGPYRLHGLADFLLRDPEMPGPADKLEGIVHVNAGAHEARGVLE
jgi:hypothetical protein